MVWCWKWQETSTKTHNQPCDTTTESEIKYITQNDIDPSRCTYKLFNKYMDIRKDIKCHKVFVSVNSNFERGFSNQWYTENPMGSSFMGQILPKLCKQAGIKSVIKGHSTKKTLGSNLLQSGLPDNLICRFTNHKDPKTLHDCYSKLSFDQHHAVNQIIQNPKKCIPAYDKSNPLGTLPVSLQTRKLASSNVRPSAPSATATSSTSSASTDQEYEVKYIIYHQ